MDKETLSKQTVLELKRLAKERGVKIPTGAKKAKIVDLLSATTEPLREDPWCFIWGQEDEKIVKNYRTREKAIKGALDYARDEVIKTVGEDFWDEEDFSKFFYSQKGTISLRGSLDAPELWDEQFFLKIRPIKFED